MQSIMHTNRKVLICRLCLKPCDGSSETITCDILKTFPVIIGLSISEGPVMCKDCKNHLQKSYIFKSICLNTQDFINSYANGKCDIELNIVDVYFNKNEDNIIYVPADHAICRLCLTSVRTDVCSFLNVEEKNMILVKISLEKCFPEIDLNVTKDPVICNNCYDSLQDYFHFVTECTNTEEKIRTYCDIKGIGSDGQVNLNSMMEFMTRSIKSDSGDVGNIDYDNINVGHVAVIKCEGSANVDGHELPTKLEQMDMLDDSNSFQVNVPLPKIKVNCTSDDEAQSMTANDDYGNSNPTTNSNCGSNVRLQEITPDELPKDPLELSLHSCEHCPYKTKRKFRLKQHMIIHSDISQVTTYRCHICQYETKHRNYLKYHQLVHKDSSEVRMYDCEACSYQTKRKENLKKHMAVHSNNLDEMYNCANCTYKTPLKGTLKRHLLTHKDDSQVKMYNCEICTYKTKYKFKLKEHAITHNRDSQEKTYQCEVCEHETRYKFTLKQHRLIHKDASEGVMYRCESCPFHTRRKENLKCHIRAIHTEDPESMMYHCAHCRYKTLYKSSLRRHLHTHKEESFAQKDVTQVLIYRCEVCQFETKHKGSLKRHTLIHK